MYDHRAIAKAMNLFHFEEHSPGMVFWHPMGLRVFRVIEDFMRRVYQSHGFEEVRSPLALSRLLWEKSGHWGKFGNNMFVVGSLERDGAKNSDSEAGKFDYGFKPVSFPG